MLKNNKNGITLTTMILSVLIIIIITTTVVVSYSSFNISARKKSFANEIYTLQKQIEDYNFRNNKYPIGEARELESFNTESELWQIFSANSEVIQNNKITLYKIDYKKLDLNSLARGTNMDNSSKDIYLFSNDTKKVYYIQGEKIGDDTYYFLNQDLYDSLKMK